MIILDNDCVEYICVSLIIISFFVYVTISDYFKYKYQNKDDKED